MSKGTVVKVDRVKPFIRTFPTGEYHSRMLIDVYNSGSEKIQVNHGLLKPGCHIPNAAHELYDELYIIFSGNAILNLDD
ncbi:MAG: hypothetical protein IIB56_18990, partial [Planctomycetes bacterium]|nr:hypothetical protein [Planctomycetota bacterium]